jgi:hypothetical protein
MNSDESMTPQQLDTRIALHSLKESSTLWRKSRRLHELAKHHELPGSCSSTHHRLRATLESQVPSKPSPDFVGILFMVFGVVSLALSIWSVQLSRLDAILEIVRRQERIHS